MRGDEDERQLGGDEDERQMRRGKEMNDVGDET